MKKRWAILIALGAFFLGIGVGNAPSKTTAGGGAPAPAPPGAAAPAPPPALPVAASAPAPAAAGWHEAISMTGNADKQSGTFTITGTEQRLTYRVGAKQFVLVAVYVLPEGSVFDRDGGFAEVTVTQPGKETTMLHKAPGRYYLKVIGQGDWGVRLEDNG